MQRLKERLRLLPFSIIAGLIICFIAEKCKAQNYDSLKYEILKMNQKVDRINDNLFESHQEFRMGTIALIIGTVATTGAYMLKDDVPIGFMAVGGFIQLSGVIMMTHSHRYIGRTSDNWMQRQQNYYNP